MAYRGARLAYIHARDALDASGIKITAAGGQPIFADSKLAFRRACASRRRNVTTSQLIRDQVEDHLLTPETPLSSLSIISQSK